MVLVFPGIRDLTGNEAVMFPRVENVLREVFAHCGGAGLSEEHRRAEWENPAPLVVFDKSRPSVTQRCTSVQDLFGLTTCR
jgi:hypothetical protein